MRLVILDDYDKASEWAAKYVRNSILKFDPGPGRHFVLGLPTGEHYIATMNVAEMVCLQVVLHWVCIGNWWSSTKKANSPSNTSLLSIWMNTLVYTNNILTLKFFYWGTSDKQPSVIETTSL